MAARFGGISLLLSLVLAAVAACSNAPDPEALESARSLVPDGSQITDTEENVEGMTAESGPYFAKLEITDGERGAGLADSIAEHARAGGWQIDRRTNDADTAELTLARGDYIATVYVWLDRTPVSATIFVSSADEGA